MRFFNKIVFSKKEPITKSDIWFDGKVWKIYFDGEWKDTQEFRDDISNPDWHASEGEAGHIENRTHYVDYPLCVLNKDNTSSQIGSFSEIYVAYNDSVEKLEWEKSLPISGSLVRLEYKDYKVSLVEEEEGLIDVLINSDIRIFGVIRKLEDIFIPDTVLKTTPQSLSSTDKNQALTNLDIDPVVWKYMCEPYVIEYGTSGNLPSDLITVINDKGNLKHITLKLIVVSYGGGVIDTLTHIESGNRVSTNTGDMMIISDGEWQWE